MGQTASSQKKSHVQKMNLAQAIIDGIQDQQNDGEEGNGVHEKDDDSYSRLCLTSGRSGRRLTQRNGPKKKSWFYYEEQIKQEEQRLLIQSEHQTFLKVNLLDLCKKGQVKGRKVNGLVTKLSSLVKQQEYDNRPKFDTLGSEVSQIPRNKNFLKLPPTEQTKPKKKIVRNFRANLLDVLREKNPRKSRARSSSSDSNRNEILSFQKSYQEILQLMGPKKQTPFQKIPESQHVVFQRKIQRDLLHIISPRIDRMSAEKQDELRIPMKLTFPETSILTMQDMPPTPISASFAKQLLNFDMIDPIQEDHHLEGGFGESPSSGDKTVKHLTQQLNLAEKRSLTLHPVQSNMTIFTLNNSPTRSAASRNRHQPSMSNPTAMFPISINQSFESVSTTVLKDLNRYEIIGRLGTGTFGKVKLARYNNEELVIRILNELRIKQKLFKLKVNQRTLFEREMAQMKHLNHPNVCRVMDVMHDPRRKKVYLICEYAAAGSIPYGVSDQQALTYFRDLICGLDYLHNVVQTTHRNLKPSNTLIDSEGTLKIADAGLWHLMEPISDQTFTLDYCNLAPELQQTSLQKPKGRPVDIWAAGMILYQLVVGDIQPDFVNRSLRLPANISPSLRNLLTAMLRFDPQQRITVKEMMVHPWVTRFTPLCNYFSWTEFDEDEIEYAVTILKN